MNRVINKNEALTKSSAFTGGLNNVLLVLMFLETLAAVSTLMSLNINNQYQRPLVGESVPDIGTTTTGGTLWTSTSSGTVWTSTTSEKPGSEEMEENPSSLEQPSGEEDYGRHIRSFDLDFETTFVADLSDINILPLISTTTSRSEPLYNNTAYEDKINHLNYSNDLNNSNDSNVLSYEIDESRIK